MPDGLTWDDAIPLTGTGPYTLGPVSADPSQPSYYPVTRWYSLTPQAGQNLAMVTDMVGGGYFRLDLVTDPGGANNNLGTATFTKAALLTSNGTDVVYLQAAFYLYSDPSSQVELTVANYGVHSAPANDLPTGATAIDFAAGSVTFDNTGATETNSTTTFIRNLRDDGARSIWFKFTCPTTGYYRFDCTGLRYFEMEVGNNANSVIDANRDSESSGLYLPGGTLDAGVDYYICLSQVFPTNNGNDATQHGPHTGIITWTLVEALPPNAWGYGSDTPPTRAVVSQYETINLVFHEAANDGNNVVLAYQFTATKAGVMAVQITGNPPGGYSDVYGFANNVRSGDSSRLYDHGYGTHYGQFAQFAVKVGDVVTLDVQGTGFGVLQWGVTDPADLVWSDWFSADFPELGEPLSDHRIGRLWGKQDSTSYGGGGWSIPYGVNDALPLERGTVFPGFDAVRVELDSEYATIGKGPPVAFASGPGPGGGSGAGIYTWVLMGQGGGNDGHLHSEVIRNEQARGVTVPADYLTPAVRRWEPALSARDTNGINTWYVSPTGNPFTDYNSTRAYIQYGSADTELDPDNPATLKLFMKVRWTWNNSNSLSQTAIVELRVWDLVNDPNSGQHLIAASEFDSWPGGGGEEMASLNVPGGAGSEPDTGYWDGWFEYPNAGELNQLAPAIANATKGISLLTYAPGVEQYFSVTNTYAARGGYPGGGSNAATGYSGLYVDEFQLQVDSNAIGLMGWRYPDTYRWGYLVDPNFDIIAQPIPPTPIPDLTAMLKDINVVFHGSDGVKFGEHG